MIGRKKIRRQADNAESGRAKALPDFRIWRQADKCGAHSKQAVKVRRVGLLRQMYKKF
ncbi:MAG: hypothetical protein NC203_06355 [Firmicutes bacterium]|nr:hypothetical protein [Bacillota bacterium]